MDEEYDVIVLGTGLKECILSGLLSVDGLKVLHMDRNDYYGGESSSLNLTQLWKRFRGSDTPQENLGAIREYNVDMIPKFIMANGTLVQTLIHTNVTKYLNFKAVDDTNDAHSVQIILPQKQLGRKSDMYLFCCSYAHNVAPKGKYIAFVSAEAETDNPEEELKPGIELLGPIDEIFYHSYDTYVPTNQQEEDNCFISGSYDATTHFESTVADVLEMYTKITGKTLDLSVDLSAASAAAEN
ncbi:hypothetical protein BRARA_C00384 [Brassica rapa]|uniref:Guanosine nucleotide diphosphate dissociation inhibitor n=1 Tax=Brassica campestris TaxID=3711 RepID=A0A397ZRU2_BRACM|nr:hypothetical protein BRARA_C00384 [Brassica rapa]